MQRPRSSIPGFKSRTPSGACGGQGPARVAPTAGMRANPEMFAGCPATADQLDAAAEKLVVANQRKTEVKASGVTATAERRLAEEDMDARMKQAIRHAENLAQGDAGKLLQLGWSGRRPRGRRVGSVPPGQVTVLEI